MKTFTLETPNAHGITHANRIRVNGIKVWMVSIPDDTHIVVRAWHWYDWISYGGYRICYLVKCFLGVN